MNKAAQHYPAEPLQPTMPLQHTTVCSLSNQLATTGCMAAGTAYDLDLPVGKVPTAPCQIHGGSQWPFAQQVPGNTQNPATLPGRFFRSFRRLFGR
jgi:penicillin-binding protein 1A